MGQRIVQISGELLTQMLTRGWSAESVKCVRGLPAGAKFLGVEAADVPSGAEPRRWTISLLYEHPDWPDDMATVDVVLEQEPRPPQHDRPFIHGTGFMEWLIDQDVIPDGPYQRVVIDAAFDRALLIYTQQIGTTAAVHGSMPESLLTGVILKELDPEAGHG